MYNIVKINEKYSIITDDRFLLINENVNKAIDMLEQSGMSVGIFGIKINDNYFIPFPKVTKEALEHLDSPILINNSVTKDIINFPEPYKKIMQYLSKYTVVDFPFPGFSICQQ